MHCSGSDEDVESMEIYGQGTVSVGGVTSAEESAPLGSAMPISSDDVVIGPAPALRDDDIHSDDDMRDGSGTNASPVRGALEIEDGTTQRVKSGLVGAIFNYINSIIGAGIIGLPFAIKTMGLWSGLLMMLAVGPLVMYTCNMVIHTGIRCGQRTYEGLMEHAFGRRGYQFICIVFVLFTCGGLIAYFIIIGDTLGQVASEIICTGEKGSYCIFSDRHFIIVVIGTLCVLPLALLRDLARLEASSFFSIASVVVIVMIVISRAPSEASEVVAQDGDFAVVRPETFFAGFGAVSFAFVCHHSSFLVYQTLSNPTPARWSLVNRTSVGISWVVCLIFTLVCYLSFLHTTEADILQNFPVEDPPIAVARTLLAGTMVFTYPLEHYVARHSLNVVFWYSERKNPIPLKRSVALTLAIWGTSMLVALSTTELGAVLEFTGGFCASILGYVLPPILMFRTQGVSLREGWKRAVAFWIRGSPTYEADVRERISKSTRYFLPLSVLVFGVIAALAGSISPWLPK